jgi:hypothetical protein
MSNFCFFENGNIRFFLSDRVKELSYTVGIGNFALEGAARGFSSFASQYEHDDYLFYAITDGVNYEVGSGQYVLDGSQNALIRFPLKTSNSNQKINFPQGVKEVYVTYPATHSVYMGSGISDLNAPQKGGVSFWASPNILDYDSSLIWDKDNQRLGINNENPDYAIHIGGYGPDSIIKTSGIIIGSSGVYFPEANNEDINYIGGRQVVHFEPNELGDANIQQIIELSGVVDNILLLKQQNAGLVFAGPPSGCSPPCSPALPSFRPLILKDIEEAIDLSGILTTDIFTVSGLLYSASGVLRSDLTTVSGILDGVSGVLRSDLTTVSGILDGASGVLRSDLTTVSGVLRSDLTTVSGVLRSDLTTVSGILDNVSGVLRSDLTTVSGILDNVSGVLRSDLTTVSGILDNVSGVLRSDLTTVSGILDDVNDKIYKTNIYDLGLISGSVALDWAENKTIQVAELDGTATTFTKGTGWPSSAIISQDLLLQLNVTSSTTITWTIVGSNWYNKPSSSILSSGEYMFLLRAFGSSDIYGFYIGENTGSL